PRSTRESLFLRSRVSPRARLQRRAHGSQWQGPPRKSRREKSTEMQPHDGSWEEALLRTSGLLVRIGTHVMESSPRCRPEKMENGLRMVSSAEARDLRCGVETFASGQGHRKP